MRINCAMSNQKSDQPMKPEVESVILPVKPNSIQPSSKPLSTVTPNENIKAPKLQIAFENDRTKKGSA